MNSPKRKSLYTYEALELYDSLLISYDLFALSKAWNNVFITQRFMNIEHTQIFPPDQLQMLFAYLLGIGMDFLT